MSHEPPTGAQPNPYGPPPGWNPPQGTAPYSQPPFPPGGAAPGGWQGGPPPAGPPAAGSGRGPRKGRGGLIAAVLVLLLLAGGGTAIALATGGDDDGKKDRDTAGSTAPASTDGTSTSPDPSGAPTEGTPTEGTTSAPTPPDEGTTPGGPQAPGEGPDESLWRGSPRAAEFQDDWEFRWEEHAYKARAVVARDHAVCAEIAADDRLADLDCVRAVTATYVNERDEVTFTNYYLKFSDQPTARQVAALKDADTLIRIDGDAVWDGWTQGSWRVSHVKRIVLLTVATAPKSARTQTFQDYLTWAHKDFALGLRIDKTL